MLHRLLKYDPGHAGKNRADDQQPSQLRVGVRTLISRRRIDRQTPAMIFTQSFRYTTKSANAVAK